MTMKSPQSVIGDKSKGLVHKDYAVKEMTFISGVKA